jgi:hypothetical protein
MVHGHFYQPPRENPWTGGVDPQPSAAPWGDWNERIAAECYLPMGRSRIYDADGGIVDLYNNYPHMSFNFGPTLLSWADSECPGLIRDIEEAARVNPSSALAQAYGHAMLPLCDARDRHTQILWGLKEFHHRFGFSPDGMWLSECGIDKETVRALVDHGVKFVILSPHQASKARPFGEQVWREASMGSIDTKRVYRLFETDGGGRTHFNRHLDVIFYTPGLNLKVSFDHILNRPDDLARELLDCFDPDEPGPQIVSIVTDGEIYGHHEKGGQEALSRLFSAIAPAHGFAAVSAGDCIRLAPPTWEVKLWGGEDKMGSSWSCRHGVGRWFRDCGCSARQRPDWNQAWRRPLRLAFDALRARVRDAVRRELGALLRDVLEARNEYIRVVLRPDRETRKAFLDRHAQRRPTPEEAGRIWALLEADRNAILMYASCGWFFDELSGIEPVQNMRYALRAAELAQPYAHEDLTALLRDTLSLAKSNIPRFEDGGDVFDRLAVPGRHDDRDILAALAACQAAELPVGGVSWKILPESLIRRDGHGRAWGWLAAHDRLLDRVLACAWFASLSDAPGVMLGTVESRLNDVFADGATPPPGPYSGLDWAERLSGMSAEEFLDAMRLNRIPLERLPAPVAIALHRRRAAPGLRAHFERLVPLGDEAIALQREALSSGDAPPDPIRAGAAFAVEHRMESIVLDAIRTLQFDDEALFAVREARKPAEELDFRVAPDRPARHLALSFRELIHFLGKTPETGWLQRLETRTLDDGSAWLAPQSRVNRALGHPSASPLALALGQALASIRSRLMRTDMPGPAALSLLPLPELLAFARRGGFIFPHDVGVDRAFWDLLADPVADLIAPDPAGMVTGEPGDRLRRAGTELGFAGEALDRRLLAAVKRAMR